MQPETVHPGDDPAVESQTPTTEALIAQAQLGDEEAWRLLVERYARRVFALAKSRCAARGGNELAEEITQSVFVTAASKITQGQYTEQGRFESWLFRVAMNRIRDEMRRIQRHATPVQNDVLQQRPGEQQHTSEQRSELAEDLHRLRSALGTLSDADREVVELRHHAGLSFKQIADLLAEPIGTLLARHHRALRKLKDTMEGGLSA